LHVQAQKVKKYTATVVNSFERPVSNVSVFVYTSMDSSLVQSAVTNSKGIFYINLDTSTNYYCNIIKDSFKIKTIIYDTVKQLWQDTIYLEYQNDNNEAAIIMASPIIIKEDTVQFSSALFKKDSLKTLEEILKKFPGVTIDREGNILIHGVPIADILLEGKPIPFNDIRQLTQTLEASAIDKIQFIDRKSEQTRITKIDDGKRDKILNIKLKSKHKQSLHQSYGAGIGNRNRKQLSANANGMNNAFYGNVNFNHNNTGKTNFNNISFQNGNGIVTGTNFTVSGRWIKKTVTINSNINIAKNETTQEEIRDRVIFLKDSLNYYNQQLANNSNGINYSGRIDVSFIPDTLGEWRSSVNYSWGNSSGTKYELFKTENNSKVLLNNGTRNNTSIAKKNNFSWTLTGGRRSKNNLLNATAYISLNNANSYMDNIQENDIQFYRSTGIGFDTLQRQIFNNNDGFSATGNTTVGIRLYKKLRLTIGGSTSFSNRPIMRTAYFYDAITNIYTKPDTTLSNNVLNTTNTSNISAGLNFNYKEHGFTVSLIKNFLNNSNADRLRNNKINQTTVFITPSLQYNFISSKGYIASQNLTVRQTPPTTLQLQPIVDSTNPLFVRLGNPNLKTEEYFTISTSFRKNPTKGTQKKHTMHFTFSNHLNIIKNKIANSTIFTDGKQVSTPINLPDVWSNSTQYNINYYVEKHKINFYQKSSIAISRDNNFLNGILNELHNIAIRPSLGAKRNGKKFAFDYNIGYLHQTNTYSLRPSQNIKLGSFTTDASVEYNIIENLDLSFDYRQTVNNNKRSLQRINNLNGSLEYFVKVRKWNMRLYLSAFDILNQNNNLIQNIADYYEEYVISNAVRRYYMFSVVFSINNFKAGKSNKATATKVKK
jgi:hypothetical protein